MAGENMCWRDDVFLHPAHDHRPSAYHLHILWLPTLQIVHFGGRLALPPLLPGLSRFGAAFFLHPDTEALHGRVLLGKGPLDLLYPLYFRATVGQDVVPGGQVVVVGSGAWGVEQGRQARCVE